MGENDHGQPQDYRGPLLRTTPSKASSNERHKNTMRIETLAVHAGYSPDPTTKSAAVPLYQTTAYAFDSAQHGADLFDLKVAGNIYSRIMNPTNDALEVERRITAGDDKARLVYEGMAYQVAKHIASLAAVVDGKVDLVVITGALAHSAYLMDRVVPRVRFLAPVDVLPGENELEALAYGILRVLRGEEKPHTFVEGVPFCTND